MKAIAKIFLCVLLFMMTCVFFSPGFEMEVNAEEPSGSTGQLPGSLVGAIRWDSYYGQGNYLKESDGYNYFLSMQGTTIQRSGSPQMFHYRLPFYAKEISDTSIVMTGDSQAIVDQEITYAKNAGIKYWAYYDYPENTGLERALKYHLSSKYKDDVSFSLITDIEKSTDYYIGRFKQSNYLKVLDGRPVVFMYNTQTTTQGITDVKNRVSALRQATINAGLPNIYFVIMTDDLNYAKQIGADAVSGYATFGGGGQTYASLNATEKGKWNNAMNNGLKVVPWVTTGWDDRPRIYNGGLTNTYVQYAQPEEIANQVKSAMDWNQSNQSSGEANLVLMYAWNENIEGGWLIPTLYYGADRLNALAKILGGIQQDVNTPPEYGENLAVKANVTASGEYSNDYKEVNVKDNNTHTSWRAPAGVKKDAWLELDFGMPTKINRMVLNEETFQSISDFSIQVFDGFSWKDIYSYDLMGVHHIASFDDVTTQKVRIYIKKAAAEPQIDEAKAYYVGADIKEDGLSTEWTFDDEGMPPELEKDHTFPDIAGGRHLVSANTIDSEGVVGRGRSFDGTAYAFVPERKDGGKNYTSPLDNTDNITVSLWVNMDSLPQNGYLPISKSRPYELDPTVSNQTATPAAYEMYIAPDGTGHFAIGTIQNAMNTEGTVASFNIPLTAGKWHHLVGIYDGRNVRVYVDGEFAGKSTGHISGKVADNVNNLFFGFNNNLTQYDMFKGKIDVAKIYTIPLDAQQVKALYTYHTYSKTDEPIKFSNPEYYVNDIQTTSLDSFAGGNITVKSQVKNDSATTESPVLAVAAYDLNKKLIDFSMKDIESINPSNARSVDASVSIPDNNTAITVKTMLLHDNQSLKPAAKSFSLTNIPKPGQNLALQAIQVIPSSDSGNPQLSPYNVTDGKKDDNWVIWQSRLAEANNDQWLELVFDKAIQFNRTELYLKKDYVLQAYKFQYFDGNEWKDITSLVNNNTSDHTTHKFPIVSASRVRLFMPAFFTNSSGNTFQNTQRRVNEIELYLDTDDASDVITAEDQRDFDNELVKAGEKDAIAAKVRIEPEKAKTVVSGAVNYGAGNTIVLVVKDKQNQIHYIDTAESDSTGSFQFTIRTEDMPLQEYTIELNGTDSSWSHDYQFGVDKTAPVTTATVNPVASDGSNGWYVHPVTVTLSVYDNYSGVAKTEYSSDGGVTWLPYTSELSFDTDGKYVVNYRSTDNAGNVETAKTVNVSLDMTAPTIAVSGVVSGTYSDSTDIKPNLTISDNLSGVDSSKTTVKLDTLSIQQGATIPLYTLPLGSHKLIVTASDKAGNTSSQTVVFQTTTSIQSLQSLVTRFANAGWIDNGAAKSLQDKLAVNKLNDFVSIVKAQSGKHITSQAAGYLLRDARYLLG